MTPGHVTRYICGIVALAAACSEEIPRTQVMVIIDAEPGVRSQARDVQVVVRGGTGAMEQWQERLDRTLVIGDNATWPFSVALVPLNGDASRVYEVTATAQSAGGENVGRVRAISGYRTRNTLELRLVFEDGCRAQVNVCDDSQTCRNGACVAAAVDATTLDAYKPSQPSDAGVLDGGIPDAEPDAGAPDTGVPDTGPELGKACDACEVDADCEGGHFCFSDWCIPSCTCIQVGVCEEGCFSLGARDGMFLGTADRPFEEWREICRQSPTPQLGTTCDACEVDEDCGAGLSCFIGYPALDYLCLPVCTCHTLLFEDGAYRWDDCTTNNCVVFSNSNGVGYGFEDYGPVQWRDEECTQ